MKDELNANSKVSASVERGASITEQCEAHGYFEAWCVGPDGKEKWRDVVHNLVTTVGKNDLLDKYLKGSAYTQTIRMGLKGAGTAVVGDTQASHAGWLELGLANAPAYTGNRKDVVMGAAAAGASVSPVQSFVFTSGTNLIVAGLFINNGGSATKDDTSGVLYSAGNFSGGDKTVSSGDTLNCTWTATV